MMTATKPKAYTLNAAGKLLGISQPALSVLIHRHDFEIGGPVFDRYVDDAIIGMAEGKPVYLTAESVERYWRKREAKKKSTEEGE